MCSRSKALAMLDGSVRALVYSSGSCRCSSLRYSKRRRCPRSAGTMKSRATIAATREGGPVPNPAAMRMASTSLRGALDTLAPRLSARRPMESNLSRCSGSTSSQSSPCTASMLARSSHRASSSTTTATSPFSGEPNAAAGHQDTSGSAAWTCSAETIFALVSAAAVSA